MENSVSAATAAKVDGLVLVETWLGAGEHKRRFDKSLLGWRRSCSFDADLGDFPDATGCWVSVGWGWRSAGCLVTLEGVG
jgi:hypothetical protein